jgi:hypothetical protein
MKGCYGDIPLCGAKKQTQFLLAPSTAGALKRFEKTNPIDSFRVLSAA